MRYALSRGGDCQGGKSGGRLRALRGPGRWHRQGPYLGVSGEGSPGEPGALRARDVLSRALDTFNGREPKK